MYWGLRNWLVKFCNHWGLQIDLYDTNGSGELAKAVQSAATRLVWIETPLNPTWDVVDIAEAAENRRASRRERVFRYVEVLCVALPLKKKRSRSKRPRDQN